MVAARRPASGAVDTNQRGGVKQMSVAAFKAGKMMAALLLFAPASVLAEVEFHLCSSYVQESAIGEQTARGWPVFIKLTEPGATSLKKFTETNRSKMTRIIVGGSEFLRATAWAPIYGGGLRATFSSRDVVKAWQHTLADELPAVPCGAED